mgnify:CR=1 FL=1
MATIATAINTRSPEFASNAAALKGAVDDLKAKVAHIAQGGPEGVNLAASFNPSNILSGGLAGAAGIALAFAFASSSAFLSALAVLVASFSAACALRNRVSWPAASPGPTPMPERRRKARRSSGKNARS